MVLSGGLPYNARLLYAAREFVQRLPIAQWKIPKKQARLVIMRILMKPVGTIWPAENGELPQPTRQAIGFAMQSWGLPESQVNPALEDFEKEFKLAIPYRTRLFRVLMKRLVARGTPLILLPISHQDDPTTVKIASPISVVTVPENLEAFAQQIATTQFSI